MRLLFKYCYSKTKSVRKSYFTVGYTTKDYEDGQALSHIITTKDHGRSQSGSISLDNSYADIWDAIKKRMYIQAEKYGSSTLLAITLHIYLVDCTVQDLVICPESTITNLLWETVSTPPSGELKAPVRRKQSIPNHIPALKVSTKKCSSFIVADTETLIDESSQVHIPYALGFCVVKPGLDLPSLDHIETYYSEDVLIEDSFSNRSNEMLKYFLTRLAVKAKEDRFTSITLRNSMVSSY